MCPLTGSMYQTFLKVVGTVKLHEAKLGGGAKRAMPRALTLAKQADNHGNNKILSWIGTRFASFTRASPDTLATILSSGPRLLQPYNLRPPEKRLKA